MNFGPDSKKNPDLDFSSVRIEATIMPPPTPEE
jgi:hypothetical protein